MAVVFPSPRRWLRKPLGGFFASQEKGKTMALSIPNDVQEIMAEIGGKSGNDYTIEKDGDTEWVYHTTPDGQDVVIMHNQWQSESIEEAIERIDEISGSGGAEGEVNYEAG